MKKTTLKNSNSLTKRLVQYGALSVAIAGVAEASGQIVYTDIADFTGGGTVDYDLDLNNDGTIDFTVDASSDGTGVSFAVALTAGVASNSFLGSAPNYVYPFALNAGDPISSGQSNWFDASANNGTLNYVSCYNGAGSSNWCGVTDKYLGLRFQLAGNTHYGWARLDVSASANSFTIKDYAFNSTPGAPINSGQTLGVNEFSSNPIKIVALNKTIGLYNLSQATEYSVMDISGKTIMNGTTNGNSYVIEANGIANGIYIIELSDSNSNSVIRKKIVL